MVSKSIMKTMLSEAMVSKVGENDASLELRTLTVSAPTKHAQVGGSCLLLRKEAH